MIRIRSNTRLAMRATERVLKQIPFATAQALNTTAEEFQLDQRQHQLRIFKVRRKQWVERNVKMRRSDFAKKDKLVATVRIEAPGSDRSRSDILAKFEEGGTKTPIQGSRLAIPDQVARTSGGIVGRANRPKAFKFQPHGSSGRVFRGEKRTWMIREPDGTGGIFQRVGRRGRKGKDGRRRGGAGRSIGAGGRDTNLKLLYRFTGKARIEDQLDFHDNARDVVRSRFGRNFQRALQRAIESGLTGSETRRLGSAGGGA